MTTTPKPSDAALLPCPFCGSAAKRDRTQPKLVYHPPHRTCRLSGMNAFPEQWNARAIDAEQPAQGVPAVAVERIVRDVAELPDRSSPEDWPEAMLVTPDELREIVTRTLAASPAPAAVSEGGEDALVPNIYRNEDTGAVCLDFDYFPDCQVSLLIKSNGTEVVWAVLNESGKSLGSFRLDDGVPAESALREGFHQLARRVASRHPGDAPIGHYVNDYAGGVGRVWPSASYGVSEHGAAQIPEGRVLVPREIVANYRNSTSIPRHRRICDEALAAAPAQEGS